jgi:FkbM family methyltransferase
MSLAGVEWLGRQRRFSALIDVGAHDGAFGAYLQKALGAPVVHAIEPMPEFHSVLAERGFQVHGVAVGDTNGEADFRITDFAPASSLLALSPRLREEYPSVGGERRLRVPVRRLDDLFPTPIPHAVVKFDVQGMEAAAIRGGQNLLRAADAVLVEMLFVPLYDGASLFHENHMALSALGLELKAFRGQEMAPSNGEPLFAHCVYVRPQTAPQAS